jgi:ribosome maturation factor RimP
VYEKWAWPTFFSLQMAIADLKNDIQQQLRELDSRLDLVAVERPGSEALRLFIDHPDGVDLALCERVSRHLSHLRADFSLEVSSPGSKHRRRSPVPETAKEQP